MTITMQDVLRHCNGTELKQESQYSAAKNKVAFELSLLDSVSRGTILERIIAEKIEFHTGYTANVTAHRAAWDITVDLEDKPVRIEVKSALVAKTKNTKNPAYRFQNIKPEHFSYLFFALVTPDGVEIYWTTKKDYKQNAACSYGNNGFTTNIAYEKLMSGGYYWLNDIEDFPYNPKHSA